jgi:hypothetical protein
MIHIIKSINTIQNINRIKGKHMIISTDENIGQQNSTHLHNQNI